MKEKVWTIIELIKWGDEWLSEKNIESARLNIELMICKVLKFDRIDLYTKFDRPLSQEELNGLRNLLKRRSSREPLQYILGEVDFRDLKLKVDKRVLIPRPETEYLIQLIDNYLNDIDLKNREINVLDLGSGSGCISLSIAKENPNFKVEGIDISQDAIDLAIENKELNDVVNCNFKQADLLLLEDVSSYDLIVSNPPYVSKEDMGELEKELIDYEPLNALTDHNDGLTFYKKIIELASKNKDQIIFLEHALNQEEEIINIIKRLNSDCEIIKIKDQFDINRFIRLNF